MATYVLVHGAGAGGWIWRKVVPLLRTAGHEVYTPSLTGCGERAHLANPDIGLETHILDVVNVLRFEDLSGVILVGHSYGGNVITGVADRAPECLAHLVYLDANVPNDGQSLVDLMPVDARMQFAERTRAKGSEWHRLGRTSTPLAAAEWPPTEEQLAPWVERGLLSNADVRWLLRNFVPHPARTYLDPVCFRNPAAVELPRTYIYCTLTRGPFEVFARRAKSDPGWRYRELESGHDAQVMAPQELAGLLMELV
jgi:pimeloyl-ACP methyl ester carboxylesterase